MALDSLLMRLERESGTAGTADVPADVPMNPAPLLGGTAGTAGTAEISNVRACSSKPATGAGVSVTAGCWMLHFSDQESFMVWFGPAADHAEVMRAYPDALAAEPILARGNVDVPDVQASTVQARCKTCLHRKQPGRSDPGYCSGRDDLPPAYGENHPLRKLPDDDGATCKWHQGLSKPDFRTVTHGYAR